MTQVSILYTKMCIVWSWGGCRESSWRTQQSLVQWTSHSRGTFACHWLSRSLLSTVWDGVSLPCNSFHSSFWINSFTKYKNETGFGSPCCKSHGFRTANI